jgi:PleD family two-component response regulator
MLSVRAASEDFERGYSAGVDDYLSKKWPDAELLARIEAGLNTVSLRRSLRKSRAALAASQDQQNTSQSDARSQLLDKLQSEIARARRYKRSCSVMVLGVHAENPDSAFEVDDELRAALLEALRGAIRLDVDTVVWYHTDQGQLQFAIVLPETGPAEVASIRQRVRMSMTQRLREHVDASNKLTISNGAASVDSSSDRAGLRAEELLLSAELCRRCMASCGARRLPAVQSSVVHQVAIPCRHGYAVADHCLELDHRYADERQREAATAPLRTASG